MTSTSLVASCGSIGELQRLIDCKSPIEPHQATRLVEVISGDEQLIIELRYWMSTMRVARLLGDDRAILAERIREIVREAANSGVALESL